MVFSRCRLGFLNSIVWTSRRLSLLRFRLFECIYFIDLCSPTYLFYHLYFSFIFVPFPSYIIRSFPIRDSHPSHLLYACRVFLEQVAAMSFTNEMHLNNCIDYREHHTIHCNFFVSVFFSSERCKTGASESIHLNSLAFKDTRASLSRARAIPTWHLLTIHLRNQQIHTYKYSSPLLACFASRCG